MFWWWKTRTYCWKLLEWWQWIHVSLQIYNEHFLEHKHLKPITMHYAEQAKHRTANACSWNLSQSCGLRRASKQVTMRMRDLQASTRFLRICVSLSSASRKLGSLQSMLASTWTATVFNTNVSLTSFDKKNKKFKAGPTKSTFLLHHY